MKTLTKLLLLLSLVCVVYSTVSAQQKARKKRPAPSIVCKVEAVPKGMVIIGYKTNPACGQAMEIIVKRPATSETVCADSPIPDGYTVDKVAGSLACRDENPLTNALLISTAPTFYGIRIGMTKFKVLDALGSPADDNRGTRTSVGKGRTWTYRTKFGESYIYFDDNYIVTGFEEKLN